jgi:hypothetical protein
MVFTQPSSNLISSWLQPLLGLAHSHGRTGPTHALPYRLQLAFIGPGRIASDSGLLCETHDPSHRVPVRACRSRYGPNLFTAQPPADYLIDICHSHLPVCHLQSSSGAWLAYLLVQRNRGWVNDPENVGESW